METWKPKTLVLSSGGIQGVLMIGSLKKLIEKKLLTDVQHYIGCSAGAILIAALVHGLSPETMLDLLMSLKFNDWNLSLSVTGGLIKAEDFYKVIKGYLGNKTLSDYKPRITFSVVNLNIGKTEYIDTMTHPNLKILDAVMASCAIPILLPALEINGNLYCDGGVVDPFPIHKTLDPEYTLGINCSGENNPGSRVEINKGIGGIFTVVKTLVNLMRDEVELHKDYDKYRVIKLRSSYNGGLINCPVSVKVSLFHEGENMTENFVKNLSEQDNMKEEDFRVRCKQLKPTKEDKENVKCILKNEPHEEKCKTFQMDKQYTLKLMYINLILYNLYHIKIS